MALKDHSIKSAPKQVSAVELMLPSLEQLSEIELIELRHQIDLRLQLDLDKIDLSEELGLQFKQAKSLMNQVNSDKDIATNQKAQIFNSVRAQLAEIVKLQTVVYSMERLKKFEVAFVKSLGIMPGDARAAFFDLYSEYLKDPDVSAG
jgi:hypothetical protein